MALRTIEGINRKIKSGTAVVLTAEEMTDLVRDEGVAEAARRVDVVTTGFFGPICSGGLFIHFHQPRPRIKAHRASINGVPAACGLGHSELFMAAAEPWSGDPLNQVYPGEFKYGGGHVIQDLVADDEVALEVQGYGTVCHPNRSIERVITMDDLANTILVSPCGALESRPVGVNVSDRSIYTFLGTLRSRMANAAFSSSGALSPLINDPAMRAITPGTRVFFGGAEGIITGRGLRFDTPPVDPPPGPSVDPVQSLMMVGDLKQMSPKWVVGISLTGYGCGMAAGVGVPIPVLDEEVAAGCGVSDAEVELKVVDFSNDFPAASSRIMGVTTMEQLNQGVIEVGDRQVPTVPMSSRIRSVEICNTLKEWIESGRFMLGPSGEY